MLKGLAMIMTAGLASLAKLALAAPSGFQPEAAAPSWLADLANHLINAPPAMWLGAAAALAADYFGSESSEYKIICDSLSNGQSNNLAEQKKALLEFHSANFNATKTLGTLLLSQGLSAEDGRKTMVNFHYVSAGGLDAAVERFGAAETDECGNLQLNVFLAEGVENMDGAENTGIKADGERVWALPSDGAVVLSADGVSLEDVARALKDAVSGNRKAARRLKQLFKKLGLDLKSAEFSAGISVDHRREGKDVAHNPDGTVTVAAEWFETVEGNSARESIAIRYGRIAAERSATAYAMAQGIFLNIDDDFISDPRKLGNGQVIISSEKLKDYGAGRINALAASAREAGVKIYVNVEGDADGERKFANPASGFAGYCTSQDGRLTVHDFLLGDISAREVTGYENLEGLRQALYAAGTRPKVLNTSELKKIRARENRVMWYSSLASLLGENLLAAFNPEKITEKFVKDEAWGLDSRYIPSGEDAAALLNNPENIKSYPVLNDLHERLGREIKDEPHRLGMQKALVSAVIARALAISELNRCGKSSGLADARHEMVLGESLLAQKTSANTAAPELTWQQFMEQNDVETDTFYTLLDAKINALLAKGSDPVAISTLIELIPNLAEPKAPLTRRKKEAPLNIRMTIQSLKAA